MGSSLISWFSESTLVPNWLTVVQLLVMVVLLAVAIKQLSGKAVKDNGKKSDVSLQGKSVDAREVE